MEDAQNDNEINSGQSLKILVIDDNAFNLDIINECVEYEGFETICMERGIAAWQYLDEHGEGVIDIILLDRMMPNMDGLELVEKLKGDPRFKSIPIIMISAAADQKSIGEGIDSGVFEYITKPFERDTLVKVVKRAVAHIS